MLKLYSD